MAICTQCALLAAHFAYISRYCCSAFLLSSDMSNLSLPVSVLLHVLKAFLLSPCMFNVQAFVVSFSGLVIPHFLRYFLLSILSVPILIIQLFSSQFFLLLVWTLLLLVWTLLLLVWTLLLLVWTLLLLVWTLLLLVWTLLLLVWTLLLLVWTLLLLFWTLLLLFWTLLLLFWTLLLLDWTLLLLFWTLLLLFC